ncbi:MAG: ribonuclease E [Desulfobacterales bacterium GWB2_56_26]|nr:MAG: ribonuclease E [Desulfobacterales bacterium GWB2_56_26]
MINAEEPEECRLALLEDGRLESIHVSTISRTQTKNNIYKAKIVAIEPSLQAAFVDYGTEKNGFLPFSEIHPEYYKQELSNEVRHLVETHQWKRLSITDVMERGQEVLAQVVKEEVGKKGANMTTYLSIPGRSVVLMPGSDSSGISRKISGEERRSQLRGAMKSIDLPEGIGWIVRTASVDINEEVLSRDVKYLLGLWDDIKRKGQEMGGVGLVYEDQESVLRFLREHFDPSIQEILVDDRTALEQVKKFVELLPEKQRNVKVRLHQGARPIFNQYSIEDQIESIYQPQVNLPSGGSIVISPTEALVAIDVNSGSTSRGKNFEASIFQANMEAAAELARQLRLRDLGGLIVVDFIDMRNRKHIQAVEKKVKESMKKDKAKVDFSRISKFGLLQISRQKLGAPIEAGNYRQCEHCKGRGTVRSVETLSLYYLRRIQTGASRKVVGRIECHFPIDVASYLQNNKRAELHEMERKYGVEVMILAEPDMKPMDNELIFHKAEKEENPKKQS